MAEPTVVTDRAAFRAAARDAEPGARVPVEVRLAVADPFAAYRRAREGGHGADADAPAPDGAFLETTGGQDGWGYFGVDPTERFTAGPDAALWRQADDAARPDSTDSSTEGTCGGRAPTAADSPTLAALQAWLDGEALARGDCDVPYPCGAIGWLSYDVARELESLPERTVDDRDLPRCQLAAFDRLAAWTCPASEPVELRITACPRVGGAGDHGHDDSGTDSSHHASEAREPAVDAAYERGLDRALDLVERIRTGDPRVGAGDGAHGRAEGRPGAESARFDDESATFESDCGRAAFAERVERIQDAIRAGETFQANVSHRLAAPAAIHPAAAYDALRDVNPAPYSALLELPAADLVSASPELLLERVPSGDSRAADDSPAVDDSPVDDSPVDDSPVDDPPGGADRSRARADADRVRTEPIAGTRPRGATDAADRELEARLRGDEKERAEHAMLVDLERNDLGKVCAHGSVDVREYRRVDRYAEVMHLVSLVEGDLRPGASLADAIAALFPGGTITGAPKPRTMQLIDEVEATRRGPYTGSIGLFGFDGRATLNIVIRTLVRYAEAYHLRVGAGIVHDSGPEREYAETLDKARALVTAVDRALGERADLAVESGGGRA